MFVRISGIALLGVLAFAVPIRGLAQMATLTGFTKDASGAVVPNASVQLANEATGETRALVTGPDGAYTFPALRPATYTLKVAAPGFRPVTVTGIQLQVDQVGRTDVNLELSTVNESVLVSATAVTLQTEQASTGQVVGSQTVVDMPLNGRNFKQLALLLPGTVPATSQSTDGTNFNIPRAQFVSNGVHGLTYSYRIDGVENVNSLEEVNTLDMSIDAIQEFKIEQNNFSVDSGRGTTVTSLVTKSGSNQFHGGAYEFLRNDALDARNFFDVPQSGGKGSFRMNQFGGDVGGPILRDKLFFFANAEARRSLKGLTQFTNFATPSQLAGNLGSFATPIPDPNGTGVFPNNQIPANRISQYARAANQYWPVPNAPGVLPGVNDVLNLKQKNNFTQETLRLDYQASGNDHLFVRGTSDSSRFNRPNISPLEDLNTTYHTSNLAAHWTRTISPRTVNEFLFGYNFGNYRLEVPSTPTDVSSQFGLKNTIIPAGLYGIPYTAISGFGTQGPAAWEPWYEPDKTYQWTDSLSMVRGTHTLKAGVEIMHFNNYSTQPFANRGFVNFTGTVTGNALADYLLGDIGFAFGGQGDTTRNLTRYFTMLYFGDDWKVSRSLTLNLGLRWDGATQPTEKNNRMAIFDPDLAKFPGDALGAYRQAGVNGQGSSVLNPERKTFAPRVGFAYRPLNQNRVVLRGGFGMFYALAMQGQDEQFFATNLPFLNLAAMFSQGPNAFYRTTDLFPPAPPLWPDPNAKFVANGQGLYAIPQNLKFPTSYQWNFAVQTLITSSFSLDIAYVGDVSRHGVGRWDVNQAVLPSAAEVASGNFTPIASRRPFPSLSSIISSPNWGNGSYNGLQIKAEKRFSGGLSFLASYSFSRAIDNYGVAQYEGGLDYYNRALDRSRSGSDARNMFTLSYTYELPFGRGKPFASGAHGVAGQVIGGWSINGITTFRSGLPLTVFDTFDRSQTGAGAARPNRSCDGNLPTSQRNPNQWFDTSCFSAPTPGTFGNSGRRIIDSPGVNNFDFSAFKRFDLTERSHLEFRSEFFNIFNHSQFGVPGMTFGTPTFGVITVANDPREIQFGLKLLF